MKRLLFLVALLVPAALMAQTLKPGYYKSADGYVTVTINHEGDVIKMKEPTRENEYRLNGGTYRHTEEKYAHFTLKVIDDQHFQSLKHGGNPYDWSYSGKAPSAEDFVKDADDEGDCSVAEKYMELAQAGGDDTQVNTFCGAAALMKCNMNAEGYAAYVSQAIANLKSIMVNPGVNPCTDVFTAAQWNAN
jgi:hypothetical protein